MSGQNKGKINQLLKEWPKGTVITQARLDKLGIYRQLAAKYVFSDWIIRIGTGAFVRSGDRVDWRGGLYALQTQLGLSVHVGGRTALALQGLSQFVPLGQQEKVILISDYPEQLPTWFRNHPWEVKLEHHCLSLFNRVPEAASIKLDCGAFGILASSPERAIMEQMRLARTNEDVEQAYQLMEGLTTLRPRVVQELLVNCRSVKVKRLFLWSAETIGHDWFKRLDLAQVELGKGKRQLYKGGRLNPKYQITVPAPEELPGV